MTKGSAQRPHGVLPPPPSTPDDGPDALEVPPLGAPPTSLQASLSGSPTRGFSLRVWVAFVALFLLGTGVTFLVQR